MVEHIIQDEQDEQDEQEVVEVDLVEEPEVMVLLIPDEVVVEVD